MNTLTTERVVFYVATGLLTALMLFSAGMYFFNYGSVANTFQSLGFPTYIIYPLAVAKILGLIAIWTNYSRALTEWAYAGFFFDFVLAFTAHLNKGESGMFAIMAMVLLGISYVLYKRTDKPT